MNYCNYRLSRIITQLTTSLNTNKFDFLTKNYVATQLENWLEERTDLDRSILARLRFLETQLAQIQVPVKACTDSQINAVKEPQTTKTPSDIF